MKLRPLLVAALVAAGLLVPAGVLAQAHVPHRFAALHLTDAQRTQIQTLRQNYRQAHPKGSAPDPAARKQLRRQILAVLTPDQRAQLRAQAQQRRAQREQHQGNDNTIFPPSPAATPI
ncbi:MAG TPA: hypothetical protein VMD47_04000 [Candidatus Acidoferrales bacterium]|nr:hypothetical protein [Candidatus Acidoferrales bacterium]